MKLSRFSKQFRMLGGGVLLTLAYAPVFWSASVIGEVTSRNEGVLFSSKDLLIDKGPIIETKLTDSLRAEYFRKAKSVAADQQYVASAAEEKTPTEPLRFTIIESGPYKGGKLVKGVIRNNFYVDARRLSIPVNVIDKVIKSLSSKIDFRRSLKKGDEFEIAYSGKKELIYSKIKTRRKQAAVYKFGKEGYFLEDGTKAGGTKFDGSFAPPVRGKFRVSSPFGVRIHPVTKRRKKHSGVDLAVGHGTPVYSIYDGVVTAAGVCAGYGKRVDVKHKNGYSSRYAHLSRMVVHPGARVRKGQLIAYSGATGMATGPHLHLELARNNVRVNPLGVKMMVEKPKRVSNKFKFGSVKNYFKNLSASVK